MGTFEFMMILVVLVCVLLVLVVLAQNPKGGGLSSSFGGGGGGGQMFGVQQTNDFLDKSTWTLGAVIVGLIVLGSTMKPNPKATYNMGTSVETPTSVETTDEAPLDNIEPLPAQNPVQEETE